MSEDFKATPPDYSGDGFSIWKAEDKNGKTYLKIKDKRYKDVVFNCFKVEKKKEDV